jgi:penicillin-binding protein/MecA-like transpeptidase family protein
MQTATGRYTHKSMRTRQRGFQYKLGIIVVLALALHGCQSTSAIPNEATLTAQGYLDGWRAKSYATMYMLISKGTQQNLSQQDFEARYFDAMQTLTTESIKLDVNLSSVYQTDKDVRLPFVVTYSTQDFGSITKQLQLILQPEGDTWRVAWDSTMILPELKPGSSLKVQSIMPARGNIYDRNGAWLVQSNSPTVDISVIPSQLTISDNQDQFLDLLSHILRMPVAAIQSRYSSYGPDYNQPVLIAATDPEVLDLYPSLKSYPTIRIKTGQAGRRHFYNLAPQILGYTGYVPTDRAQEYIAEGHDLADTVGLAGLEMTQDSLLSGQRGKALYAYALDTQTYTLVAHRSSQPGQNVYTTLDRNRQIITQDALEDAYRAGQNIWASKAGGAAAIVVDIHTGEVLAMASYPDFDANVFMPDNHDPVFTNAYLSALYSDVR